MKNQTCFHCNSPITDPLDYKMYAIDRPYVNLFFHKSCFVLLGGYSNIVTYCTLHGEKVYNSIYNVDEGSKNKKNGTKREKKAVQGADEKSVPVQGNV